MKNEINFLFCFYTSYLINYSIIKMKSCKKQTNKSRWRILDDVDIIAQCMKLPLQMDTVITRIPFVHAIFKSVAYLRCRANAVPSVSATNVNRRAHIIYYVAVTFRFDWFHKYCNREIQYQLSFKVKKVLFFNSFCTQKNKEKKVKNLNCDCQEQKVV